MNTIFRAQEYKVLFYRIFLVYVFYFVARALFLCYNFSLLGVDSISEFKASSKVCKVDPQEYKTTLAKNNINTLVVIIIVNCRL